MERTKLSRARSLGGTAIGIFFMPIVSLFIWNEDQTPNARAFFIFVIIAGVLSIIFYMLLLTLTTERYSHIETDSEESGKKLLVNSDRKVSEIAEICGYGTYMIWGQAFRSDLEQQ